MRILATPVLCALLPAMAPLANADTLLLKNGSAIEGTLLGADTRQVQFMGGDALPCPYADESRSTVVGLSGSWDHFDGFSLMYFRISYKSRSVRITWS